MKSNSNIKPFTVEAVGNGSYTVNYNVVEAVITENGIERLSYDYDTVTVWGKPTYESVVSEIIKERYNYDFREAAVRKGIANPNDQDYITFNEFAENTKIMAKELLKNVQL